MADLNLSAQLQHEVSIERLLAARGISLTRKGSTLTGTCPLHPRAKTALVVNTKKNTWACASCRVTVGTVVDFVAKADGISKKHAVEILRADLGHDATEVGRVRRSTVQRLDGVLDGSADDAELLRQVASYYCSALKKNEAAVAFLARHGLQRPEVVEHFSIGFADRTLGYHVPTKDRRAGAELRGRLQRLGVLRASGHELFRGCITVPVVDGYGRVVSIYGRRVDVDDRKHDGADLWLKGAAVGVFNVQALKASKEIVVVSSVFDALAAWSVGVKNVMAAVADEDVVVDHLRRHDVTKVTLAYPRTDIGDSAASALAQRLEKLGAIEVMRALLPAGMDVAAYCRSTSFKEGALADVLRRAEWVSGTRRAPAASAVAASPGTSDSPPVHAALPTIEPRPIASASSAAADRGPTDGEIVIEFGDRRWRVRGLAKNTAPETMKINLFVSRDAGAFHVDSLDLYSARQRATYTTMAATELGLDERAIKKDMGDLLLRLEELRDELAKKAEPDVTAHAMTEAEREAALALLRDPRLLNRILADFERCGVVGETDNKLVGYLAAVSRKLARPLGIIVQSSSAAGKSSLMEAVLDFVPEEDRRSFSALTGQSLFYMGGADIRHKVLAVAEHEGAERASYSLKLLQSEGSLTISSTGKDPATGRLTSHEYRVNGPVAIFMTTTSIDIDEELLGRCLVLSVDEGAEQTRAIHERQRQAQTLDGIFARHERETVLKVHRDAQRLLQSIAVVNPFSTDLAYDDHRVRARRDHQKYLGLIEAIALLHQHQREVKTAERSGHVFRYIEVTREDVAIADRLRVAVMDEGRDELPPATRRLLDQLDAMVTVRAKAEGTPRSDLRFSRREAREQLGVGGTQLWLHLRRLVDAEYLVVHPSHRGRGVVYELAVASAPGARPTPDVRGEAADVRGPFGPDSGAVRGHQAAPSPEQTGPAVPERSDSTRTRVAGKRTSSRRSSKRPPP